jgi:hypothetical protein
MKFALSVGLLAVFALTACEIDEPPPRRTSRRPVAKYPNPAQTQYRAEPQPFPQDQAPPPATTSGPVEQPVAQETAPPTSAPAAPSTQAAAKGDYPYGVPVPGKPGFVRSPYSPDKMTDVRGYAPGTEVKDPYTQKIFLVP